MQDKAAPLATGTEVPASLPLATTLAFAAASGLSVANIYYAQPLLDAMAADFGIRPAAVGLVVTLTQIGYALGLILIVPLGDLLDRRTLIVGQTVLSAIALTVVATARNEALMLAGMVAVGLMAVVVQLLVAFTAALAPAAERGKSVGMVTSGIVSGILLARVAAGLLAELGGWRAVYLTSAALTLGMAVLLVRILPRRLPSNRAPARYGALLRSVPALFLQEPVLRVRAILALLIFASFSTFWTPLVLPLRAAPLSLSHSQVGLFGLIGLAGALAAGGAGRLADRGFGQWTTGVSLALLAASWIPIAFLSSSLAALVAGVLLLDLAVQAVHVTNQSLILAVRPDAGSRIVGGYMVFYSAGSALGSIASTAVYAAAGWVAVCALGAGFSLAALALWGATRRTGGRRNAR